jgi:hypothetical protein
LIKVLVSQLIAAPHRAVTSAWQGTFQAQICFKSGWILRIGGLSVRLAAWAEHVEEKMDGIIYLVGLIVVIMAVLSFFGLH